jgi:FkbH-like protein
LDAAESLTQFKKLRAAGEIAQALLLLQQGLRRGIFDADSLDQVGRLLSRHAASFPDQPKPLSVLLVGQYTTSWLVPALTAIAWGRGRAISVREGGYDNVIQDLATIGSPPDVVVIAPWKQRVLGKDDRSTQQRIDDEIGFLAQSWNLVARSGSRLVQIGYDWDTPGPLGHHLSGAPGGNVSIIRQLNQRVRSALPQGAYFVDLEQISGEVGRHSFYDPRSYYWTKQPFSRAGVARLCEHLWAGIRAVTTGPKKVLVLDLDNTIWGGVVGELGALGVALGDTPEGESFRAFQREACGLAARGVVLAACSKNNTADAREVFEKNNDMILKLADFAAFEATWDPKPTVIERIAKTLRLGLDSFVFFDDNPAEREHVLQMLPDVEVVNVPADPAGYVRALQSGLWFESVGVTEADKMRKEQYRDEQQRREVEQASGSVEAYLESLQMVADVRKLDEPDMERAVQLLGKSNQFNLTTRRHTAEIVRRMMAQPRSVALTFRLADRFGDAGLIAVVLATPLPEANSTTLLIDTWLMSCRVIARTTEDFTLNYLVETAKKLGYRTLQGEFIPTAKNQLVADLYDRFGFTRGPEREGGGRLYTLDLSTFTPRPTPIKLVNHS